MKKSLLVAASVFTLCFMIFGFTSSNQGTKKITICHIPPGNPGNCHEITISVSALETHIGHHGDALICPNKADEPIYHDLSIFTGMPVRNAF